MSVVAQIGLGSSRKCPRIARIAGWTNQIHDSRPWTPSIRVVFGRFGICTRTCTERTPRVVA
eukprot:13231555-Alexandrium_andersonii.AAC.1